MLRGPFPPWSFQYWDQPAGPPAGSIPAPPGARLWASLDLAKPPSSICEAVTAIAGLRPEKVSSLGGSRHSVPSAAAQRNRRRRPGLDPPEQAAGNIGSALAPTATRAPRQPGSPARPQGVSAQLSCPSRGRAADLGPEGWTLRRAMAPPRCRQRGPPK